MHAAAYIPLFVLAVLVLTAVLIAITRTPGHGDEGDGGSGGAKVRPRPHPRSPNGSDGPPWWPEFERELGAYVDRHGDEQGQPVP